MVALRSQLSEAQSGKKKVPDDVAGVARVSRFVRRAQTRTRIINVFYSLDTYA